MILTALFVCYVQAGNVTVLLLLAYTLSKFETLKPCTTNISKTLNFLTPFETNTISNHRTQL